jgi:PAS domain S-box-containing protein
MPTGLERKLPIILFFVLLIMVAIGYLSYSNTGQLKAAVAAEKHTQQVIINLDETLLSMVDIETGMRGFFIQGNEELLEPYKLGKDRLPDRLAKLRILLKDDPDQNKRLDDLQSVIDVRIADADQKVETRRNASLEDSIEMFKASRGKAKMDDVRAAVEAIKKEEFKDLAAQEEELAANLSKAVWILIGVGTAGILTLALANIVVFLEVKKRRRAEEDLKDANKGLEKRVEQRTSELAKANKELGESEIFRRAVIDSLAAHIAVLDKEGNILLVNEAWERFAESNVDDAAQIAATGVGQNYLGVLEKVLDNESIKTVRENLRAVLEGKSQTFTVEYECHSKTEERWFLMQANALHSSTGGLVISHYNITDRVKAEQSVKLSEEFNRSIVENSPDCVKVLELDGAMLSMNYPGMCLMEIDDFRPFVGQQWTENWEGEGNEQARAAVVKARGGEASFFEGFCTTAKGTPKWWEVSVAPVLDDRGKPHRLLVVSREISGRKKAQDEREELLLREQTARKEAEVANRLRDEFMASVSHELRTPLNSILGWARLLKGGMLDENIAAKAVDTIIKSSETQNRLIEDLLDVARLISGKLELEITQVNVVELISNSIEAVRPMVDARHIALNLEIDDDCRESQIPGDVNRLQQVVWNLLTNAVKFSPDGGRVNIGVAAKEGFIELEISDNGRGISPEFLPFVFERFRQDSSNIEKRSGLGLGLAIVRHLVELHGGSVRARSEGENKGSVFTVSLPVE